MVWSVAELLMQLLEQLLQKQYGMNPICTLEEYSGKSLDHL